MKLYETKCNEISSSAAITIYKYYLFNDQSSSFCVHVRVAITDNVRHDKNCNVAILIIKGKLCFIYVINEQTSIIVWH